MILSKWGKGKKMNFDVLAARCWPYEGTKGVTELRAAACGGTRAKQFTRVGAGLHRAVNCLS